MHIPDIPEIVSPSRFDANTFLPAVDKLEDAAHDRVGERRRSLRETLDELIEELFSRDLQMKRVSARLDEGVEQREGEHAGVWISMVRKPNDGHGCFTRTARHQRNR